MPYDRYPFELPPLPYAYEALEPYIDTETMHYHHDKHFAAYTSNLNKALEPYPALQALTLEQLLTRSLPPKVREPILRNGGGVYNHGRFFNGLRPAPEDGHTPNPELAARIDKMFGSYTAFQEAFTAAAMGVFGSGWVCLGQTRRGELNITVLHNQETVVPQKAEPVLIFDVWEHAYYLKYKNARADYVKALWNVAVYQQPLITPATV